MKDWESKYKKRVISIEKAIQQIVSRNRVVIGHAAGEPVPLVDELVNQKS